MDSNIYKCLQPGLSINIERSNVACHFLVLPLIQVSQAAAELQQYCMQNACKDALLVGVPAGSNPFREPRSCALL
ncbi:PREDICTED: guanine nucleotide-binding protein G(I)/G(S)/G(O) subunit gamma-10 [Thamnophis sirtalis]|uniref:Guanine nucleotide-binding protein subunit gamma n=2 Tax=Sauria TaxID=32561 RepID=A0A6I9XW60_9SAUR|nr:PREDICTED: guanine nucleotide-binding protein G(I)/G(S)/G(O) subunit gamma-10 [Thamnophis sirtalis]